MAGTAKYISVAGKFFYPSLLWKMNSSKTLYLTFDDGPVPGITPWVLLKLKEYNARATFFCIGENISKNPDIFEQVLAEGHSIGNHTFNHLNGWKTTLNDYLNNVQLAEEEIKKNTISSNRDWSIKETGENKKFRLFRPPYGKVTPKQINGLHHLGYKIVMWDVISYDFSHSHSSERCYDKVIKNAVPGSIIVFHDSLKASKNLKKILPQILNYYHEKGFAFKAL